MGLIIHANNVIVFVLQNGFSTIQNELKNGLSSITKRTKKNKENYFMEWVLVNMTGCLKHRKAGVIFVGKRGRYI